MGPIKDSKSRKELNKARKQESKKWKEASLIKKAKKIEEKKAAETVKQEESETCQSQNISTITIAVPGSILENAQSQMLKTYLAGQIARAACIFQVDEVVVFDDYSDSATAKKSQFEDSSGPKLARKSCVQLGRILQYLECPQYLRKHFFPMHEDLNMCGLLNPLDAPHHLRIYNQFIFREGVVTNKPVKSGRGSLVNVGLKNNVYVDKLLTPGIRCTVKLEPVDDKSNKLRGTVVSPSAPRKETGVYWGYTVRLANSLSQVFSQSPYKNGYDMTIGTSDKGSPIDEFECPKFEHLLIIFGGLQGLEAALETDDVLKVDDPSLLFDHYLNVLPAQGSRTIRTEEAVLITMAALQLKLNPACKPIVFTQKDAIAQSSEEPGEKDVFTAKQSNSNNLLSKRSLDLTKFD